jgi:hypothetical protein
VVIAMKALAEFVQTWGLVFFLHRVRGDRRLRVLASKKKKFYDAARSPLREGG